MRQLKVALAVASSAAVLAAAPSALAAGMDPTPERLYLEPAYPKGVAPGTYSCRQIAAQPTLALSPPLNTHPGMAGAIDQYPCLPNNAGWANMMSELGMAIAPTAFHPARTTGLSGFALSLEVNLTHINADARDPNGVQYWHQGTQGSVDPNNHTFSNQNNSPDSLLQVYLLKARKGLAYGFEIAGALGYVSNTSLWVGGGDVHWSLLEGFRTGLFGYLPDIAVGGGVRTLGGSPKFFLTTVGIDAQVSKPFTLADSAVLTPYIGGQRVIIFADSTVVNLAPNANPLTNCGYQGNNVPGNPNAPGNPNPSAPYSYANPSSPYYNPKLAGTYDGSPVCSNIAADPAAPNAFNNLSVFNKARIHRWRGIVGVDYRYEVLYLAGQFAMDLTDPSAENANLGINGSKQWTLSLEAGVYF